MNIKQKMIEAMRETYATHGQKGALRAQMPSAETTAAMLDAALAVLVDLDNWGGTDLAELAAIDYLPAHAVRDLIKRIREQEA